jgi:hypothetical protein
MHQGKFEIQIEQWINEKWDVNTWDEKMMHMAYTNYKLF